MTKAQQTQIEAAAFRGLVQHLQQRTDAQNIDLMNLAGFCRNCLAKWYSAEAKNLGLEFNYSDAQKVVYGMTYDDWKTNHQTKATDEQLNRYEETSELHAKISGY